MWSRLSDPLLGLNEKAMFNGVSVHVTTKMTLIKASQASLYLLPTGMMQLHPFFISKFSSGTELLISTRLMFF